MAKELRPPTSGYSLWLRPKAGKERLRIQKIINGLAASYGCPVFDAHITVLTVPEANPDDFARTCADLARLTKPFSCDLVAIGSLPSYFQALFLMASPVHQLWQLNQLAREAFEIKAEVPYAPHLSLAYGDSLPPVKELLKRNFNLSLPLRLNVTELSMYDVHGFPPDWKQVAKFPLKK